MRKNSKDSIVLGLALFAMFFGAGNLIFPPSVGIASGDKWLPSMIGFFMTGIGLPLLGVMAIIKAGGTLESFSSKVGKRFSMIFGITVITSLGLVAVSRTAATTFEMGIAPVFPSINPVLSSIIFFGVSLALSINPSGIIDRIGKLLTPILLLMLSIIVFKGIIRPIGTPINTNITSPISNGFLGGYQTMDALGSAILGGIIITSLLEKGYTKKTEQLKMTMKSVLIAGLGLSLVYGGLLYLGATGSSVFGQDMVKTTLTVSIAQAILGDLGKTILGLCVSFACLTTSVGLTATIGNYFEDITNKKISYKSIVIITSIICGFISNVGVETIVKLAGPLLTVMYPITIVLIILNLLDDKIKNKLVYKGAIYGALSISLFDGISSTGLNIDLVNNILNILPFSNNGFGWVLPSFIGILISYVIYFVKNIPNNTFTNDPIRRKAA